MKWKVMLVISAMFVSVSVMSVAAVDYDNSDHYVPDINFPESEDTNPPPQTETSRPDNSSDSDSNNDDEDESVPPVTYKESVDDAVKKPAEIKRDELTESEAVSMIREQVSQGNKNATITIQNKTIIKSDTWRSIMLELLKKDAKLTLIVDNVEDNAIKSRLYIDTKKAFSADRDIWLQVTLGDPIFTQLVKALTGVNVKVIQFQHTDIFKMDIQAAVKMDLSDMDTANLYFYKFDEVKKTFTLLENTHYYVDKNGYLHFTTNTGGTIIVSDESLIS